MTTAKARPTWRAWRPRDRKTTVLTVLLVLPAAVFLVGEFYVNRNMFRSEPFGDFFALWSWARVAVSHSVAALYDRQALYRNQVLLGMPKTEQYPFAYPPNFLIFIGPLAFLRFYVAYALWIATTFAAYLVASCRGLGWTRALVYTLVLAPTTAVCASVGQSGFLLAALLAGGARLVRSRPVLAGILFGLLTYKPQFGLLVPLALLASRQFVCIAAAAATAGVLVLATSLAFGVSAWLSWTHALASFGGVVYKSPDFIHVIAKMPTVFANLRTLGLAGDPAWALQLACGLFAAAAVWFAWRRWPDGLAVPILLAATYLTTPYAFDYDLPALSTAVVLFAVWRSGDRGYLAATELVVMVLVLFLPVYTTLRHFPLPVGALVILAFLALLLLAGSRAQSGSPHVDP